MSAVKKSKKHKFVELTHDLMPLPKGVYRLTSQDAISITLSPSPKIFFTVMGNWQNKIRRVTPELAKSMQTSEKDFIDRYYAMMHGSKTLLKPGIIPPDTYTMCCIDQSLAREIN